MAVFKNPKFEKKIVASNGDKETDRGSYLKGKLELRSQYDGNCEIDYKADNDSKEISQITVAAHIGFCGNNRLRFAPFHFGST
ncbi:hypothetical protein GCM10009096_02570 [Parasphingorhabdus litoris]|uniref:Uncharacterized protein n=1 Tax=Parasphingorhabdus litoris TaxID=394733 RepID=A0ABN1A1S9_9SPHN